MNRTFIAGLAVSFFAFSNAAQALDPDAPLGEALASAQVRDCRSMDTLALDVTTSGADVVTLYANGSEATTLKRSHFERQGLDVILELENDFLERAKSFLRCETPIIHATQAQLNMLADLASQDERVAFTTIYRHGWSNGGAALVAKKGIQTRADLNGAVIAVGRYGPHVGWLAAELQRAEQQVTGQGETWSRPTIFWTENLVGFEGETPGSILRDDPNVDAAFVNIDDANILTSGGTVGNGAEGSLDGGHILLTTKSANRVISHVYAVRTDYFKANTEQIHKFVFAMFKAEDSIREDILKKLVEWDLIAEFLLQDDFLEEEAKNLWRTFETVGLQGNREMSGNAMNPTTFAGINNTVQAMLIDLGLLQQTYELELAAWNYDDFAGEVYDQRRANLPSFDTQQAKDAINRMARSGNLGDNTLEEFQINFQPNQATFTEAEYAAAFRRVIQSAQQNAGAIMSVYGHADPYHYLRQKVQGAPPHELKEIAQATRNLSVDRTNKVVDAIINAANNMGITMDRSQFTTFGEGIEKPLNGKIGDTSCWMKNPKNLDVGDPCPPQSAADQDAERRVIFRMVVIEGESEVFTPAVQW